MRTPEFLQRATLPVLLTASLGMAACSSSSHETAPAKHKSAPAASTNAKSNCTTIYGLTGVDLIGANKEGSTNAVNSGECAGIYSPDTWKSVGDLAAGAAFDIKCIDGPKPAAFRITVGNTSGDVDLNPHLIQELVHGDFKVIPNC